MQQGVGLMTGLGWSNSEDEDTPSPLTREFDPYPQGLNGHVDS